MSANSVPSDKADLPSWDEDLLLQSVPMATGSRMEQVDWTSSEFPVFETGKDGFLRPGKILRYYRERKKEKDPTWTQNRLARELGITEKSVRNTENFDVGFDSISLRRKLATWFNIPLILLGLASLEDEANLGQTIKRYRKIKGKTDPMSTQANLARALGITEKAVRDMENQNKGLDSITRRRVLAHLLTIPPAALGIVILEEVLMRQQTQKIKSHTSIGSGRNATLDLASYQERLKTIWNRNHTSTAQDIVTLITTDIASLRMALPYVNKSNETEVRDMLCRYQLLYAHIMRDQGQYNEAIEELEKVAEKVGNPRLPAATLLRLGGILCDRGDVTLALAKIEAARGNTTGSNQKLTLANTDYIAAIKHFARARNLGRTPPELNAALLLTDGNAQAHVAHGNRDAILVALALIKQGGKIIDQGTFEDDEFSLFANSPRVSKKRYHLTKASALLAVGWPREALQELTDLMNIPPEGDMTRMNGYTTYLWSQAYADIGNIDAATTPAQDTLGVMKQIRSKLNMTRIAGLQGQLSLRDSKHIEVIRLGVMVNW